MKDAESRRRSDDGTTSAWRKAETTIAQLAKVWRCYGPSFAPDGTRISASTAEAFFRWLSTEYRHPQAPLAMCWRLLAPTDKELSADASLGRHALVPTLENIQSAIVAWFRQMASLPDDAAKRSRAFLFFSGHGIEVSRREELVLLPAAISIRGTSRSTERSAHATSGMASPHSR